MIVVKWFPFRPAVVSLFQAVLVLLNNNISAVGSLSEVVSIYWSFLSSWSTLLIPSAVSVRQFQMNNYEPTCSGLVCYL